jgi:hypothetical protein
VLVRRWNFVVFTCAKAGWLTQAKRISSKGKRKRLVIVYLTSPVYDLPGRFGKGKQTAKGKAELNISIHSEDNEYTSKYLLRLCDFT